MGSSSAYGSETSYYVPGYRRFSSRSSGDPIWKGENDRPSGSVIDCIDAEFLRFRGTRRNGGARHCCGAYGSPMGHQGAPRAKARAGWNARRKVNAFSVSLEERSNKKRLSRPCPACYSSRYHSALLAGVRAGAQRCQNTQARAEHNVVYRLPKLSQSC